MAAEVQKPAETGEVLDKVQPLTEEETTWFAECERIVGEGLGTFRDVGLALQQINEQRLYREHFETFVDYLKIKWDMSESQGYRLMDAAAVNRLAAGSPIGEVPTEAWAREFASILHEKGGDGVVQALVDVEERMKELERDLTAREVHQVLAAKGHIADGKATAGKPSKLTAIGAIGDRLLGTQKALNRFAEGDGAKGKLGAKPSAKALQYAAVCKEMAKVFEGMADQAKGSEG